MASINKFYSALKKSLSKNKKDEDDDNAGLSMDRWNGWNDGKMIDDCVGVLLSYLSLKDKFRLESVSRQWKRKIFWSIGYIKVSLNDDKDGNCCVGDINEREIFKNVNTDILRKIFKKCENIECVEFAILCPNQSLCQEILSVIANNCLYLSHLKIFSPFECDHAVEMMMLKIEDDFPNIFINGAHKLKKLEMLDRNYGLNLFSICVNLEELNLQYTLLWRIEAIDFPKLKSLKATIHAPDLMTPEFAAFCDRHANRLKRINLTFKGHIKKEELMCAFIQINKFVKLKFISIYLWNSSHFDLIKIGDFFTFSSSELNELKKMLVWNKLKGLSVMDNRSTEGEISFNLIYQSFIHPFLCASDYNLESFHLDCNQSRFTGSFKETFCVMPKLKTLALNSCVTLDGFYKDLDLCAPNLTKLYLYSRKYSTNQDKLIGIENLSQLEILKFQIWMGKCDKYVIEEFITNYSSSMIGHKSLRMVQLTCSLNYQAIYLTSKDIRQLCAFASTIPSIRFKFFASSISLEKSVSQMWIDLSQISIPKNLDIYTQNKKPFILNGTIIIL